MFETVIGLGIASLLVTVFAEYAGIRDSAKRGFSLIAGAGVLYILAGAFSMSDVLTTYVPLVADGGAMIFGLIGWIFLLVGALMSSYKLAME